MWVENSSLSLFTFTYLSSPPQDGVINPPTYNPQTHVPILRRSSAKAPCTIKPGPGLIPNNPHPNPNMTLPKITFHRLCHSEGYPFFVHKPKFRYPGTWVIQAIKFGSRLPGATKANEDRK